MWLCSAYSNKLNDTQLQLWVAPFWLAPLWQCLWMAKLSVVGADSVWGAPHSFLGVCVPLGPH